MGIRLYTVPDELARRKILLFQKRRCVYPVSKSELLLCHPRLHILCNLNCALVIQFFIWEI